MFGFTGSGFTPTCTQRLQKPSIGEKNLELAEGLSLSFLGM